MNQMKKTRVLVLGRFPITYRGGVQHYAFSILEAFSLSDYSMFKFDYLVSSPNWTRSIHETELGHVYSVPSAGIIMATPLSFTFYFWALYLLFKNKYDVVHFNFPDPLALLSFIFIGKRKKSKWIVTWHSDVLRQRWSLRWYMPLLNFFYKKVDLTLFGTEALRNTSTQFPGGNSAVVPFYVSTDRLKTEMKPVEEPPPPFFFALGRFVYYKGFENLIEAMTDVPATLCLCGNGPLLETYKQLIKSYKLENKVIVFTDVSDELAAWFYRNCHAFCLPSVEKTEAFGYVQIEAMSFGKPVINCDLGNGVNEVASHMRTALTSKVGDIPGLANNLKLLLNDQNLYEELSKNALDHSQNFGLKRFVSSMAKVYSV